MYLWQEEVIRTRGSCALVPQTWSSVWLLASSPHVAKPVRYYYRHVPLASYNPKTSCFRNSRTALLNAPGASCMHMFFLFGNPTGCKRTGGVLAG